MVLYKSKIQCPNCEGCGSMASPYKNAEDKREIKTTICKICNGKGFITGDIRVLVNEKED